jgi:hypothetical protein
MRLSTIEFRTEDGRDVVLRALKMGDINAVLKYANTLVREKKVNRDLASQRSTGD